MNLLKLRQIDTSGASAVLQTPQYDPVTGVLVYREVKTLHVYREVFLATSYVDSMHYGQVPFEDSLEVFVNGVAQLPNYDYVLAGPDLDQIVFLNGVAANSSIMVACISEDPARVPAWLLSTSDAAYGYVDETVVLPDVPPVAYGYVDETVQFGPGALPESAYAYSDDTVTV